MTEWLTLAEATERMGKPSAQAAMKQLSRWGIAARYPADEITAAMAGDDVGPTERLALHSLAEVERHGITPRRCPTCRVDTRDGWGSARQWRAQPETAATRRRPNERGAGVLWTHGPCGADVGLSRTAVGQAVLAAMRGEAPVANDGDGE